MPNNGTEKHRLSLTFLHANNIKQSGAFCITQETPHIIREL